MSLLHNGKIQTDTFSLKLIHFYNAQTCVVCSLLLSQVGKLTVVERLHSENILLFFVGKGSLLLSSPYPKSMIYAYKTKRTRLLCETLNLQGVNVPRLNPLPTNGYSKRRQYFPLHCHQASKILLHCYSREWDGRNGMTGSRQRYQLLVVEGYQYVLYSIFLTYQKSNGTSVR